MGEGRKPLLFFLAFCRIMQEAFSAERLLHHRHTKEERVSPLLLELFSP